MTAVAERVRCDSCGAEGSLDEITPDCPAYGRNARVCADCNACGGTCDDCTGGDR